MWGAGGNASLNLKTVDGKVSALVGALLELQLGHPEDPRPGAKPEAEPVAAYQPHARRHRGPGRQARDNARRDAWRARRQETLPSPQATPPPPPIEPIRRLIREKWKVKGRVFGAPLKNTFVQIPVQKWKAS